MSEIVPNTAKSNLNIKKRKTERRKKVSQATLKAKKDAEIVKNADIIFGLDNGATGTLACIIPYSKSDIEIFFTKTFSKLEDNYQKDAHKIQRIDWENLKIWFEKIIKYGLKNYNKKYNKTDVKISVVMERPMVNVDRFKQSNNALRAFESTIMVLEMLNLKDNYVIIDSKKWQHYFFGKNTIMLDLKLASRDLGIEFIKSLKRKKHNKLIDLIMSHGDADSLLISKFALEKLR